MAKSRIEKNKKLYEDLDKEMKNSKENIYEEKLSKLDPSLMDDSFEEGNTKKENNKKTDSKKDNVLDEISKEVNTDKKIKKDEIVVVKEKKKSKKEEVIEDENIFTGAVSFTDKLSVEEILRAKIEKQEQIKNSKKAGKKAPTDKNYTSSMMQERIKQHEGVDVRKETNIKTRDFRWLALTLLFIALISVLVVGVLLVFKII